MHLTLRLEEQEGGKLTPEVSSAAGTSDAILRRLFVKDRNSGKQFLVDTGADVSVIPRTPKIKRNKSKFVLHAANGTPIPTYGQQLLQLDFGLRRAFRWPFLIADVSKPILGTDFLSHFNLLVDLRHKRLIDNDTKLNVPGYLGNISSLQVPQLKMNTPYSDLLKEFPEITRSSITSQQQKHGVEHAIVTKGQPVTARAHRLAPEKLKATKLEFEYMLQQGLCRPSKSSWASPLHLVAKKNGDWRPCDDYHRLNDITEPDRYPIPFLQDCVQFLHSATIFSTIDLVRAYQQIPVKEEDIQKTAIITPFGLFEFPFMTFGLRNAAQTFQRFMDEVVRGLDCCYVYLDDIIVASRNPEEHRKHLKQVFHRLQQSGIVINIDKCVFGASEVTFLSHHISSKGLMQSPQKVQAIQDFKLPTTVKDLRRFLGMVNFYNRFLPNAARNQILLQEAIAGQKKGSQSPITWTKKIKTAFKQLKDDLANSALLAFPDPHAQFSIQTDALGSAIGAVLQQFKDNAWQPLCFFSRKLTTAQGKYSAYDRELLAVYAAIKHFRFMVEGRNFFILSDHKPLIFAFAQKPERASPRQARYLSYISEFTTDIRHVAGKDNLVTDTLSRIDAIAMPVIVDLEELAREQATDEELQRELQSPSTTLKLHCKGFYFLRTIQASTAIAPRTKFDHLFLPLYVAAFLIWFIIYHTQVEEPPDGK